MGDRRNVELTYDGGKRIYLYTHWDGTLLPFTVAEALDSLEGRSRWDDDAYLARIIFEHMIRKGESKETGYGISPDICDMDAPHIRIDLKHQTVDGLHFSDYIQKVLGKKTEDILDF